MPTKTERILGNLPRSFLPARARSALGAVTGAVGGELQQAEVSLARILRAHWVDSADEGARLIDDLARIGSMWGLSPLRDPDGSALESVEQFRDHLKRHVRTVLEGRVTVRGVLQVAAETLGLRVAVGDAVDVWWKRRSPWLVTTEASGEDAATLVFGRPSLDVRGADAQPAIVRGTVDLTAGADLESGARLKLQVDADAAQVIDLGQGRADLRAVPLQGIVEAVNAAFPGVASAENGFLVLRSRVHGPEGRLELEEVDADAALAALGVPAHIYTGQDPRAAELRSSLDLSGGVDLERERFLRLTVDATRTVEVDCADPASPGSTLLDRIRDAINEALGAELARHDNQVLTVRSPTGGSQGSVFVREPAAQDCARRVFGDTARFVIGTDARPATVTSVRDLSGGVDLGERSMVRIGVDGAHPVAVNCAGADPSKTTLEEVVATFNAAFGPEFARTDGRVLTFSSRVPGRHGELIFGSVEEGDALPDVLGFGPRVFNGRAAVPASFTGGLDLSGGVDLTGSRRIGLLVDDQPLKVIDLPIPPLRSPAGDEPAEQIRKTDLDAIVAAIDAAVGQDIASRSDTRLILTSTTTGAASRLAVVPLDREVRRRFVSRTAVLDEAAVALLGFVERHARGEDATRARVASQVDLRFGADLREDRWLRISLDGAPGVEFACAGNRPHATTVDDVAAAIRANLLGLAVDADPRSLTLVSPSAGARSRIAFEPVRARDAMSLLFGAEPAEIRGQEAGTVSFVATVDLSKGIELPPGASVMVGVDAVAPAAVVLNGAGTPVRRTLSEIVTAINQALQGGFAGHDGQFLTLTSRGRGEASRLAFEVPTGVDVTKAVFGIPPPRVYQASEARRAVLRSQADLPDPVELGARRFLRISVDGLPARVVDCSVAAADPANPRPSLDEIRTAINRVVNGLATLEGRRLVLTSRTPNSASRIRLEPHVAGDARAKVFGTVPDETRGADGTPAEITGDVSHSRPLDLSEHRHLLVSVDGGRPVEIDVAGSTPAQTTLDEVVEAINRALPALASRTPDRQLRLRAASAGSASTLDVLPRRFLELVEFPEVEDHLEAAPIGHGDRITVRNTGVAEATARIELTSIHGTAGAGLVNHRSGRRVALDVALRAGERAVFEQTDAGPRVTLILEAKPPRVLQPHELHFENIVREPLGELLALAPGATEWIFMECVGPRFDTARYDEECYPGSPCRTVGLFDIGRLDGELTRDQSIYAPEPMPPPSARVAFRWSRRPGGAFDLRLPAELPPLFGGRFNEARYGYGVEEKKVEIAEVGQAAITTTALVAKREVFDGVVFQPRDDKDHFEQRLEGSHLLEAQTKRTNVPLGFVAQGAPFRDPRFLRLGEFDGRARLFVSEEASEELVELIAREPGGEYGRRISVSMRPAGPGRYLLEVAFPGDRFECGRALVLGPPEGALTAAAPGILQAKAAGVRARVSRERTRASD